MVIRKTVFGLAVLLTAWYGIRSYDPVQANEQLNRAAPSIASPLWINSAALRNDDLRGKVFLVEFWTFDCYNCRNVEPYVKQWYKKYHQQGFEVIAVHSPEFSHEKIPANVRAYVERNGIGYPVAIDNDFSIWKRFNNHYWPAMYLVDKKGNVRYYHFGEGRYRQTESKIRELLGE